MLGALIRLEYHRDFHWYDNAQNDYDGDDDEPSLHRLIRTVLAFVL